MDCNFLEEVTLKVSYRCVPTAIHFSFSTSALAPASKLHLASCSTRAVFFAAIICSGDVISASHSPLPHRSTPEVIHSSYPPSIVCIDRKYESVHAPPPPSGCCCWMRSFYGLYLLLFGCITGWIPHVSDTSTNMSKKKMAMFYFCFSFLFFCFLATLCCASGIGELRPLLRPLQCTPRDARKVQAGEGEQAN